MDMTDEQFAFVADVDPAFRRLRADVRADINTAETAFRVTIIEMLQGVATILPAEICEGMTGIVLEVPAKFIRDMLPFFQGLSEMKDQAEVLTLQFGRAKNAHLN